MSIRAVRRVCVWGLSLITLGMALWLCYELTRMAYQASPVLGVVSAVVWLLVYAFLCTLDWNAPPKADERAP